MVQSGVGEETPPVRIELIIEFVRALIRNNPSGDLLSIAMSAAKDKAGATQEEVIMLWTAVLNEKQKSPWPKGFF